MSPTLDQALMPPTFKLERVEYQNLMEIICKWYINSDPDPDPIDLSIPPRSWNQLLIPIPKSGLKSNPAHLWVHSFQY